MIGCTVPLRRVRKHLFVSAVLAVITSSPLFAAKPESVPDWVRTAATQKLPTYSPETNAAILLDDTTYSVSPDGSAVEHYRSVIKILRPQGRDEAIVYVPFDHDTKILSLHVWSIGPDGHEYEVKDKEIAEFGYPGQGNLFEDIKFKAARAPGRDPGGIVAYEYEQRVLPYLTEKTWHFQSDTPRLHQVFTLELPPGYTYGTVWTHHEQAKVIDLEHRRWRWEMNDTPAIELQHVQMRPSEMALAGRMTVHYAPPGATAAIQGSWQGIGEWYQTLSKDRILPTP